DSLMIPVTDVPFRYNNIHEYQLEHPTKVIEWTAEKELLLPLKLFADDNQGLCAERDAKVVHGGFSDGAVHSFEKTVNGYFQTLVSCVVTNDGFSSKLLVWDLGGGDCGDILHGSQISDIQLTELMSGKPLYSVDNNLFYIHCSLFGLLAVYFSLVPGDLYVGDTRKPSALQQTPAGGREGAQWCMGVKTDLFSSDPSSCSVARLSSSCQVFVSGLRDLRAPVSKAQLDVQRKTTDNDFLKVTWAPALDNCLAVSGFDGMVEIYNTASWRPELVEFQLIFVHRGHTMSEDQFDTSSAVVTTHVWHPSRPKTVLSAAVDGSVHLWDWVDKATASC
uniref:WD repeat domain 73 n=1 Tax=Oncorhynchus tshawytscha TaxID=74940 RepID=A0A8C8C8D2_ONCTS